MNLDELIKQHGLPVSVRREDWAPGEIAVIHGRAGGVVTGEWNWPQAGERFECRDQAEGYEVVK